MKKQHFKNLSLCKRTISALKYLENIKGGNTSKTSCLCGPSQCDCLMNDDGA